MVDALKECGGNNIQVLHMHNLKWPWLFGARLASDLSETVLVGFFNNEGGKGGSQDDFNFNLNGEDEYTKGAPYRFFKKPPVNHTTIGIRDADMVLKVAGGGRVNATQKSVLMHM